MLNTGLYQGRTKAASDTLPLAVRSLFASLKSEGKVLVVPECSVGKAALVQGRSCPGFIDATEFVSAFFNASEYQAKATIHIKANSARSHPF